MASLVLLLVMAQHIFQQLFLLDLRENRVGALDLILCG